MRDRAIIFDVDGVLVDSYEPHFQSWRQIAEQDEVRFGREEFERTFGQTSRDIIKRFWNLSPEKDASQVQAIDRRKEAAYRDIVSQCFPAMPGAVELIDELHDVGFGLAVGSSGPPENIELVLKKLGRADKFAARVTGMDVSRGKPDPQVFLLAASRLGIDPTDCLVIEDAAHGIEAARRARMSAVGLARHDQSARELLDAGAHLVVRSLQRVNAEVCSELMSQPK